MFPLAQPRRPGAVWEQYRQEAVLARKDEMSLEEYDNLSAVRRCDRPPRDRPTLLLEQLVGDLNGHDPVEPVGPGEFRPVRGLADAAIPAGPARPERADIVTRAAHRPPRKKASSRAKSRRI